MKTIGVLFGGKSVEHEVSVITGIQVMENLDPEYSVVPIYVKKDGTWLGGASLKDFKTYKEEDFSQTLPVYMKPGEPKLYMMMIGKKGVLKKPVLDERFVELDCVINALHGTNGEDGAMQGLLEAWGVPYTGTGVLGSALGMDKVLMKEHFDHFGIRQVPSTWFLDREWKENRKPVLGKIKDLGYPVMVKPASLGSSIGISRVDREEDLEEAVDLALSYDHKVLVEVAIENPRELNISVLGHGGNYELSPIEEPKSAEDLLTFDEKYIQNNKQGDKTGQKNARNIVDPGEKIKEEIHDFSIKAMMAIEGSGVARIDFLLDQDKVYLNEINTQPGSMAFYLWEEGGLNFKDLLDRILDMALEKKKEEDARVYSYESNLFQRTGFGSKL